MRDSAARVMGYLQPRRAELSAALKAFLARKRPELERAGTLGPDACRRIEEFALGGKMIRGALVRYAASLGQAVEAAATAVGVAMELFQSALLIHDDIMDRDTHRRGRPSIHHQYSEQARDDGVRDASHLGESLGICAGDIAFFLAFESLATVELDPPLRARLISLFARELSLVGVAQMMDMSEAADARDASIDNVLRLYLYKTGRYTFSLPLAAGAMIGGLNECRIRELEAIGEHLGVIFQIKDDEIGLFGDPADTGKPVGSDIREGKKTIFRAALLRRADPEQRERVRALWGSPDIADEDTAFLLGLIEAVGARDEVAATVDSLAGRARVILDRGDYPLLEDFLDYSLSRRA